MTIVGWPGAGYLTQFDRDTRIKHGLEIHIWAIGAFPINHDSSLHHLNQILPITANHYISPDMRPIFDSPLTCM